ncbi:MAG: hypothetical protein B7Y02_00155 [Rhodobacterales bacterium 17-64-5]|nr:MAG: hypothetical protein B7Y02_00155 [Rhodobacterales bacterium 17-64-5]
MKQRNIRRSLGVRLFRWINRHKFAEFGQNVYVFEGVDFSAPSLIELADDSIIQRHSYLGARWGEEPTSHPRLTIGSGSNIGPRNHIFAHTRVEIGRKVITAPNVFISDCSHEFSDPNTAIMEQDTKFLAATKIGDGSWLGHGSVIIGCTIGKHCVVGANSVVLSDLPDYSVAVGAPAQVVKQFDPAQHAWVRRCGHADGNSDWQ